MVFHTETNSNKHFVEISDYFKILRGVEIDFQPHFLNHHSQVGRKSKISFSQTHNLIKPGFFHTQSLKQYLIINFQYRLSVSVENY